MFLTGVRQFQWLGGDRLCEPFDGDGGGEGVCGLRVSASCSSRVDYEIAGRAAGAPLAGDSSPPPCARGRGGGDSPWQML